jgi:hypothetical protein
MKIITQANLILVLSALLVSGCATTRYPATLTAETGAKVRVVSIVDEISTPTSLTVPGAGGGIIGFTVQLQKQKNFTSEVRANLDFQKFTEDALRESFTRAVKGHAGWKFFSSDDIDKADAAFLLEVTSMGVDNPPQWPPSMDMSYPPTITISVTLIGNPPFEIVRTEGKAQALDPTNHPVFYQRVELISNKDKLPRHFSRQYSDDPEIFKTAFSEAIDLAVKRIAASWAVGQVSQ